MQYCPHKEIAGRANVIVAGNALPGTLSVISPFESDDVSLNACVGASQNASAQTSAGIAAAVVNQGLLPSCSLASSDKFSVDTLFGLFILIDECKSVSPDILIPIAKMALYEHGDNRDLAHIIFIMNSWMDVDDSPLNTQIFQLPESELANVLFEELLLRAPKIIAKVDYLERYWLKEELKLALTESLLDEGEIEVETLPDLDTAVFSIAPRHFEADGRLGSQAADRISYRTAGRAEDWVNHLHPIAVHNRTSCSRILLQAGSRRYFYYRAESAALCTKALVAPRRDLSDLARELNRHEAGGARWHHDPVHLARSSLALSTGAKSSLSEPEFLDILASYLRAAEEI